MIRWLKSLFAWRIVTHCGAWVLSENRVTGRRQAIWTGHGYSPLPGDFLRIGDIVCGPRGRYVIGSEEEIWRG